MHFFKKGGSGEKGLVDYGVMLSANIFLLKLLKTMFYVWHDIRGYFMFFMLFNLFYLRGKDILNVFSIVNILRMSRIFGYFMYFESFLKMSNNNWIQNSIFIFFSLSIHMNAPFSPISYQFPYSFNFSTFQSKKKTFCSIIYS